LLECTLTHDEEAILRGLIGATLESFEGSPIAHDAYYERIAINTSRGRIVISNAHSLVDVGYESGVSQEEAGVMHISHSDSLLDFDDLEYGPELSVNPIGLPILGIDVIVDEIKMLHEGVTTNSFSFAQAVIFHLDAVDFVVDRGIWFEVVLRAYVTACGEAQLRNTSADWDIYEGPEAPYRGVLERKSFTV
jgi:hypothetical protein